MFISQVVYCRKWIWATMRLRWHDNLKRKISRLSGFTVIKCVLLKCLGGKTIFFPLSTIYFIWKQHTEYLEHVTNPNVELKMIKYWWCDFMLHTTWGTPALSGGRVASQTAGMVWQKVLAVLKPRLFFFQIAVYLEAGNWPMTNRKYDLNV